MYRLPQGSGRGGGQWRAARGGYHGPPQPRANFNSTQGHMPTPNLTPLNSSHSVISTDAYVELIKASGQNLLGVAQALQSQSFAPSCSWPMQQQVPYQAQPSPPGAVQSVQSQAYPPQSSAHGSAGFPANQINRGPVHTRIGPVAPKVKTCNYCKVPGHLRRFCPKLSKKHLDERMSKIICRKCMRPGHVARTCPDPKSAQKSLDTAKPPAKPAGSIPKNRSAGILKKKSSRKGSGLSKDLQDLDDAVLGDPRVQVDGSPPTSENDKSS